MPLQPQLLPSPNTPSTAKAPYGHNQINIKRHCTRYRPLHNPRTPPGPPLCVRFRQGSLPGVLNHSTVHSALSLGMCQCFSDLRPNPGAHTSHSQASP